MSEHSGKVNRSPLERFEVHVRPNRDVVHLEPTGELDMATAPLVRRRVEELVAAGFTELVIDLRGLGFIDGSGLRLLLELDAEARSGGWDLTLIEGDDAVQWLFTITGNADRLPFAAADGSRRRPRGPNS